MVNPARLSAMMKMKSNNKVQASGGLGLLINVSLVAKDVIQYLVD